MLVEQEGGHVQREAWAAGGEAPMISDRGAGMAQAGAFWRDADVARRAGHVARVLRCAGCHGLRKVCERALAKMRGLAGKESGVFGRDASWQGRSRAGEEAGGATGCGGLRA